MKKYLKLTPNLRCNIARFLITNTKPYKIASHDALARWIINTLQSADHVVRIFTSHSIRSAWANRAATRVSIDTVLRTEGGGAWEYLLNITTKIIFLKKTFQIVFWTRFVLTFYLSDKILLSLIEFVLQIKFILFKFPISLSWSLLLSRFTCEWELIWIP